MALALTTKRSTVAAVASILAAMALAVAVAGRSCRVSQPGPEVTVREMLQAARTGDSELVWELLSPETRDRLTAQAKRSIDFVGATVRYNPKDLISIGGSEGVPPPTDITVVDEHGDRAVVEIVSSAGRWRMSLLKIDGRWRVDVPQYPSD
jgi:hypothetical protein